MKINFSRSSVAGIMGLAILLSTSSALAQSGLLQISGISKTTLARSGRLEIFGTNFGNQQGASDVVIDGLTAIATTWTNTEIHAYVPEQASLGEVPLQVVTAVGASTEQTITVTLRQAQGRFRWSFQVDSTLAGQFTAVGADGTVYATDNLRLYALTPDGGLQWVLIGAGGGRPINIGADGTIYTGAGPVHAVNPDGTLKWTYLPPGWPSLLAGPNLGPDGNIYALQDTTYTGEEELGLFSLDPDGNLRWNNNSDPFLHSTNGDNSAIKFGSDRMYFGFVADGSAPPSLYSFDLEGDHLWSSGNLGIQGGTHPQLDPFGRVIFRWGQVGMQALSPDGDVEWISQHPDGNLLAMPAIDADGIIYTGGWLGMRLWSINPDGSTRWLLPAEPGYPHLINLALTPDDSLLFAGGNGSIDGWVRGYCADDGTLKWQEELPYENDFFQFIWSKEQTFTPDSQTAYFTTRFGADGANGYVHAINTSTDPTPPVEVHPDSFTIIHGVHLSGGVVELSASDNADLSIQRATADVQSRTEFEVQAVSPFANPGSLEVTLEGSVFARSTVNQTIELFDYVGGAWEQLDTRAANRFSDATVTVAAIGDLSRFVEPGTMSIEARIRYESISPRQRFSSNTDQFIWTIGQ